MRLHYLALTFVVMGAVAFLGACGGQDQGPTAEAATTAPVATGDAAIASLAAPAAEAATEQAEETVADAPASPAAAAPAETVEVAAAPAEAAPETSAEHSLRVVRVENPGGSPRIAVDEPILDFGKMEVGERRDHSWTIRNIGDADLEIRSVRPSCGCTNTAISDELIPPGGSTTLVSTLDLPRQTGPVRKNIAIHSNDPQQGVVVVAFVGEATQAIVLEPPVISFQGIDKDEHATQSIDIRATEDEVSFQILEMDFMSGASFEAEIETVEEGRHYRVHLSTLPPFTGSHVSDRLTIQTDDTRVPMLQLPVVANITSDIIVAPDVIRLSAATTDPIKRVILLRGGRVKEFSIIKVELPSAAMEYAVTERQPGMLYVEVENIVASPELDGAEIVVHTDVPSMSEVRIPFAVVGATASAGANPLRVVGSDSGEGR